MSKKRLSRFQLQALILLGLLVVVWVFSFSAAYVLVNFPWKLGGTVLASFLLIVAMFMLGGAFCELKEEMPSGREEEGRPGRVQRYLIAILNIVAFSVHLMAIFFLLWAWWVIDPTGRADQWFVFSITLLVVTLILFFKRPPGITRERAKPKPEVDPLDG